MEMLEFILDKAPFHGEFSIFFIKDGLMSQLDYCSVPPTIQAFRHSWLNRQNDMELHCFCELPIESIIVMLRKNLQNVGQPVKKD